MSERHNRLTLLKILPNRSADNHIVGLWRCDCGNEKAIVRSRVRNGYTKSCGCMIIEAGNANATHGHKGSPVYSSWSAMRDRCLNPNSADFARYGAVGISVHPAFDDFAVFLAEVGERPDGKTIDRIDTRKGYEPGNIRWATPKEQAENTTAVWIVEIRGVQYPSMEEAARQNGVTAMTILRWCEGYFDQRRPHSGHSKPRPDCRRWRKYAD